jgi:hypothetical protein
LEDDPTENFKSYTLLPQIIKLCNVSLTDLSFYKRLYPKLKGVGKNYDRFLRRIAIPVSVPFKLSLLSIDFPLLQTSESYRILIILEIILVHKNAYFISWK